MNAAPKLGVSKQDQFKQAAAAAGMSPDMNPEMLAQFSSALQNLPKGQLQQFQSLMAKAMAGKDVTEEAEEFEKNLPSDLKKMVEEANDVEIESAEEKKESKVGKFWRSITGKK